MYLFLQEASEWEQHHIWPDLASYMLVNTRRVVIKVHCHCEAEITAHLGCCRINSDILMLTYSRLKMCTVKVDLCILNPSTCFKCLNISYHRNIFVFVMNQSVMSHIWVIKITFIPRRKGSFSYCCFSYYFDFNSGISYSHISVCAISERCFITYCSD